MSVKDFAQHVTSQLDTLTQSQDIAEEAIARDLEEEEEEEEDDDDDVVQDDDSSSGSDTIRQYDMINSYRRP